MSVKSWGDTWVIELLSPRTISFLLPLHLKVVDGHQLLHSTPWSFKSPAERSLFPQQYLSVPGAEHLKPATKGWLSFVKHNKWRTKTRTGKWTEGWVTGEQTADTILMSCDEASHTLELGLYSHWVVLTEHLPGEANLDQGSPRKQRGDSHGKETLCIMLYAMNFCKCSTAPAEEAGPGLSVLFIENKYERSSENPREMYLLQVAKNFCPTLKNKNFNFPDSCKVKDEKIHKTILEMHTLFL